MANKVSIDGKEYTERSISYIEIDGVRKDDKVIQSSESSQIGNMNVSIIVKDNEDEKLNLLKSIFKVKENKSWIGRVIDRIKKFFNK